MQDRNKDSRGAKYHKRLLKRKAKQIGRLSKARAVALLHKNFPNLKRKQILYGFNNLAEDIQENLIANKIIPQELPTKD